MPRAVWNGTVIAETDAFETVEGNVYFPADSVKPEYLQASETTTVCVSKGTAPYYTLRVNEDENPDAAWYYPEPKPAAANIKDMIAFWRGVTVEP